MNIVNGRVVLQDSVKAGLSVLIESGKIARVGGMTAAPEGETIDAKGLFVSPGFIDTHIHGDPAKVLAHEVKYGTTAIVSAISCCGVRDLVKSVERIRRFRACGPLGPSVLGLRLEGPFISRKRAGAQNKKFIVAPSETALGAIIDRCDGLLRIMTIAPELKGAIRAIRSLKKREVIASIGHTDADYSETIKGIRAGASHATHLYNGMRKGPLPGSERGCVSACLADKRVMAEVICDLIHVSEPLLRAAFRAKGKGRIILITDSVSAQERGRKPKGGVYRLQDGTIAGSGLTMIEAVGNAVRSCGVELKDAVRYASLNPARLLGLDKRIGSIAEGKDADIVIFDENFNVKMTMVRGRIVYRKA